ncbi:hypothetical protein LIER_14273 [Lithospermum erythrorhizon]|uniref:Uncharacterized protein n=1 Tax=Lithospermum erythrorhizon TaxID=34254 RepID=A0AAV3Q351_LITER
MPKQSFQLTPIGLGQASATRMNLGSEPPKPPLAMPTDVHTAWAVSSPQPALAESSVHIHDDEDREIPSASTTVFDRRRGLVLRTNLPVVTMTCRPYLRQLGLEERKLYIMAFRLVMIMSHRVLENVGKRPEHTLLPRCTGKKKIYFVGDV